MPKLSIAHDIHAPRQLVYDVSQDYAVRFDWDPFPDKLEMLGGTSYAPQLGGQVFVRGKLGLSMVVEFIQIAPPERAAIKMVKGPWFLAVFAGSWIFHESSPNTTRVEFTYTIQLKNLPMKKTLEKIVNTYFSGVTEKRLTGLKRYCETRKSP